MGSRDYLLVLRELQRKINLTCNSTQSREECQICNCTNSCQDTTYRLKWYYSKERKNLSIYRRYRSKITDKIKINHDEQLLIQVESDHG
jgi:hypothetical protein